MYFCRRVGELIMTNNRFGVFAVEDFALTGAKKLEFSNNRIDHTMKESMTVENVKDLMITGNMIGFSFSQPIIYLVIILI